MSLSISYIVGDKEFSLDLPPEAVEVMVVLAQSGHEEVIESIIGDISPIQKAELVRAINALHILFEKESDRLPFIYYISFKRPRKDGDLYIGAGFTSGVIIKGERYTVEGGVNKCRMTREWQDEEGQCHQDHPIDIRGEKLIKTDPEGGRSDLTIIKTKKPKFFLDDLSKLRVFLIDAKDVNEIIKETGY
ncbi:MAG: hypothetical protein ACYSUK_01895 [Planctomycetota bacterium]|jgi:hypothetical protein